MKKQIDYNPKGSFTIWQWILAGIGLILLQIRFFFGKVLCQIGLHHELKLTREESYEQGWRTGICERCRRRIR